jgi:hypothetical protein
MRLDRAAASAAEFDLEGAIALLDPRVVRGCEPAEIARLHARGLVEAQAAFREGGSPESLAAVREAIRSLEAIGRGQPGPATISRLTLQAAAAAAQSERDEMRLYLEAAVQMESLQRAAGQPGAPLVSAAETAGDLWLQVHRYEDAWRAYAEVGQRMGRSPRVLAGLARSAQRLGNMPVACEMFRQLLGAWGDRAGMPPQVEDARAYVTTCMPDGGP